MEQPTKFIQTIKNITLFLTLFSSLHSFASTKLLLIGGGDYPTETLKLMVKWAGYGRLTVITYRDQPHIMRRIQEMK